MFRWRTMEKINNNKNQNLFTEFLEEREQELQNHLNAKFVSRNNLQNQINKLNDQLEKEENEILVVSGSLTELQFLKNTL